MDLVTSLNISNTFPNAYTSHQILKKLQLKNCFNHALVSPFFSKISKQYFKMMNVNSVD